MTENSKSKVKKQKKHPGGRPTKFTKEIKEKILGYIENGATYRRACLLSGISETTFQYWKKSGSDAMKKGIDNKFSEFSAKIQQAEEKYIDKLQQYVNTKAVTDGKLALEVLARKRPKEFGKKDTLKIQEDFNVMEFDVPIPEEEKEEALRQLQLFFKKGYDPKEDYTNGQGADV